MKFSFNVLLVSMILLSMLVEARSDNDNRFSALSDYYDVVPDVANCQEGQLKNAEKIKVLNHVNFIRSIHGLKPVTYNYSKDTDVQKAALIIAATEDLDHTPPSSVKCWSQAGYNGSETSNLHIKWFFGNSYSESIEAVNSWMIDRNISTLGHRRWIIDPFLKDIAFGRVDGNSTQMPGGKVTGATIYVISNDKQNLSDWNKDFVAYPFENYPSELVYDDMNQKWHLSFTAIFDKVNYYNNSNVNFGSATIEVKNESNQIVASSIIGTNNEGYAVPNCLLFDIPSLTKETKYFVTIKNVKFQSQTKDFTYWFKVTDLPVGNPPNIPELSKPTDKATGVATDVTLEWLPADNANTYTLQVAEDQQISIKVRQFYSISATNYKIDGLEPFKTYYWRVKAVNNIGSSEYSQVFSFTTKGVAPSSPIVLLPAEGDTEFDPQGLFIWNATKWASKYHLQISMSDQFYFSSLYIDNENLSDTSFRAPDKKLPKNTKLYWRVAAIGDEGKSQFCETISFRTALQSSVNLYGESDDVACYPNPCSNTSNLSVDIKDFSRLEVVMFNTLGRKISKVFDGNLLSGSHLIPLDISGISVGDYFLLIKINDETIIRNLTIER